MTETQTVSAVMGLPEWTVLAVISEQPTYGFAVAQLTAADGDLGRAERVLLGQDLRELVSLGQ